MVLFNQECAGRSRKYKLFELLMFDMDGTLVDSRLDIARSVNLTLDEMGLPDRPEEEVFGYIGGGVHSLILKSLPEDKAGLLDMGVDLFWANYRKHVLDSTRPYPGVYEMLDRLSDRKLAVVTNKPCAHTRLILHGLGMDRYFLSVQGWKEGLKVKPDPELVLRALDETGAGRESSVLIGDSAADVLSARAAGVKSCAVGYGYGVRERVIEAAPDYYVDDVGGIVRLFG